MFCWGLGVLLAAIAINDPEVKAGKIVLLIYMITEFYKPIIFLIFAIIICAFVPCIAGYFVYRNY